MENKPRSETLLVVDDDDSVREFTVRMLKILGYNVLSASDGQKALALFKENTAQINLIMTDMVMPNMTGREFVDAVRGINPQMIILFVSGYGPDDTLGDLVNDPRISFFQKPYTRDQLSKKIQDALNGR